MIPGIVAAQMLSGGGSSPSPPPPPGTDCPAVDNVIDFIAGLYVINGTSYSATETISDPTRVKAYGLDLRWPEDFSSVYAEPLVDPILSALLAHIGTDFSFVISIGDVADDGTGTNSYPLYVQGLSVDSNNIIGVFVDNEVGSISAEIFDTSAGNHTGRLAGTGLTTAATIHRIACRRESAAYNSGTGLGGVALSIDGGAVVSSATVDGAASGLTLNKVLFGGLEADSLLSRSQWIRWIYFLPAQADSALPALSAL